MDGLILMNDAHVTMEHVVVTCMVGLVCFYTELHGLRLPSEGSMDQDYSITDNQDYSTISCKTDADCPGSRPEEHGECRNGKCNFFMYGWFGLFLH